MRDYLSDILASDEGENLKTPKVGKAQKYQQSPSAFENVPCGQGSKGIFDTFDTSPHGGYSKIQPPADDTPELPAHIRDGLAQEGIQTTTDEYGPRLTMKMSSDLYIAVSNYRRERYLSGAGKTKAVDRELGTFMSLAPEAEELLDEAWIEFD